MTAKILVVDDEPDVLLLCRVNLEFEGYDVIEAHDGEEAIRKVFEEKPSLILLDVMMPGLDGWKVLEMLKDDASTQDIPVVMLTAKVREVDQIQGLSEGAADYVTKPFNPLALSRTVKDVLNPGNPEEPQLRRQRMLEKLRLIQPDPAEVPGEGI